jgi:hypothetical protein
LIPRFKNLVYFLGGFPVGGGVVGVSSSDVVGFGLSSFIIIDYNLSVKK